MVFFKKYTEYTIDKLEKMPSFPLGQHRNIDTVDVIYLKCQDSGTWLSKHLYQN